MSQFSKFLLSAACAAGLLLPAAAAHANQTDGKIITVTSPNANCPDPNTGDLVEICADLNDAQGAGNPDGICNGNDPVSSFDNCPGANALVLTASTTNGCPQGSGNGLTGTRVTAGSDINGSGDFDIENPQVFDVCDGTDGTDGTNGTNGDCPVVRTDTTVGAACPASGVRVFFDTDTNCDGQVNVTDTVADIICDGADGTNGDCPVVRTDTNVGAACANGGTRVFFDTDTNCDGQVDVTDPAADIVCNGIDGDCNVVTVTSIGTGSSPCFNGGVNIDVDFDADCDGANLTNVTSTDVCNGLEPIVSATGASSGQCPSGGTVLTFGIDSDGSGALNGTEINTAVVCNGLDSLIETTALNPGDTNCPNGGLSIISGTDTDDDGTISDEGLTPEFVCNGLDAIITQTQATPGQCNNQGTVVETCVDTTGVQGCNDEGGAQTSVICNGIDTIMEQTDLQPDSQVCPSGGVHIDFGRDTGDGEGGFADGILQPDEINGQGGGSFDICDGVSSLIRVTPVDIASEFVATPCKQGGVLVEVGLDNGDNNTTEGNLILDTAFNNSSTAITGGNVCQGECDTSFFVCDGLDVTAVITPFSASVTNENNGQNTCLNAGTLVEIGVDDATGGGAPNDGNLNSAGSVSSPGGGEVDSFFFVCDGISTVIRRTPVVFPDTSPTTCSVSGELIEVGLDDGLGSGCGSTATCVPGNLALDTHVSNPVPAGNQCVGECDTSFFLCDGLLPIIDIFVEDPGANCTDGGHRLDIGFDNGDGSTCPGAGCTSGDGVMQFGEIDDRIFVCDGEAGADGANGAFDVAAAGGQCPNGGSTISVGADDDGNGTLDAGEVDQTFTVCDGSDGADGSDGSDGSDGAASLTIVTPIVPGSTCAGGGSQIQIGADDNGNGSLDAPGEVDNTFDVCNGETVLVALVAEPAGQNCANGGTRVNTGLDNGAGGGIAGNGILEAGEATGPSTFVCDGADGATSLVNTTQLSPHPNCNGDPGVTIDVGLDDDGNGTLDAGEIDATTFVCDGSDGVGAFQSLIVVTDVAAGATCENGGTQIDVGLDNGDGGETANDDILGAGEIDQTEVVCNGVGGSDGTPGDNGANGLINTSQLDEGDDNCPTGGLQIDVGLDDNGNGTLEAGEVDDTVFVCNGLEGSKGSDGGCCSASGGGTSGNGLLALLAIFAGAVITRRRRRDGIIE